MGAVLHNSLLGQRWGQTLPALELDAALGIPQVPKEERVSGRSGPPVTWGPGWVVVVSVTRVSEAAAVRSHSM